MVLEVTQRLQQLDIKESTSDKLGALKETFEASRYAEPKLKKRLV